MQVAIDIPDFVLMSLNKDIHELSDSIKLNAALMFYKNGQFSIEQASSFANLEIYEFIKACKKIKSQS